MSALLTQLQEPKIDIQAWLNHAHAVKKFSIHYSTPALDVAAMGIKYLK
jgi:hypothetical protein